MALNQREFEMIFRLNAQLNGGFSAAFQKAQQELMRTQKEVDTLSKTQRDISAYRKQQGAIDATAKKLAFLTQQHDNIQREISETEGFSSALENRLVTKKDQIDRTSAALQQQAERLNELSSALRDAGVDTDKLTSESGELQEQIEGLKQKQTEIAEGAGRFGTALTEGMAMAQQVIVAAGIAKGLGEIYEFAEDASKASREFESAMTGVAKTTDMTDAELAFMGRTFKELSSKEIPATTTELASVAETAGQLGIAKNNLLGFTEQMAMLGTATNMTSEESAVMLAQMTSITRMDPSLYGNLGSAIVALGNKYATTERNIADMSQTISAAASISGMTEADILAVSAAVTSLGISTQNGGTQMNKLIADLNSAVSSGEELDKWASVAGVTAEDFALAWGDNAAGALDLFIRGLNETYMSGRDVYGVLADLGITETRMVTMMTSLAKSGDRLTNTLSAANAAWAANTALTAEAEKRYATTESQLVLVENAQNRLRVAIGDAYNPALREAYGIQRQLLNSLAEYAERNPEIVQAVTVFTGVIGIAAGAVAAYTVAANAAAIANKALSGSLGVVMLGVTAAAALVAVEVQRHAALKNETEAAWKLTAASRAEQKELLALEDAHRRLIEAGGETTAEAALLRQEIAAQSAELENGVRTLEDFKNAHDALMDNYSEMSSRHADTREGLEKQARTAESLIAKLEELSSGSADAAANKQEILAVMDALNAAMPSLAVTYDQAAASAEGYAAALRAAAEAEAAAKLEESRKQEYTDRYGNKTLLSRTQAEAKLNLDIAQAEYNQAAKFHSERLRIAARNPYGDMSELTAAEMNLEAARGQLDLYADAYREATAANNENESALVSLHGVMVQAFERGGNINGVISAARGEIDRLILSYNEAYNAALDSIQGQYSLWDTAAEIIPRDIQGIISAQESQKQYWDDYNANLALLTERTGEIEGLGELLSTVAAGTPDAVNLAAGLAEALSGGNTDEIRKLINIYKEAQEAEEKTAETSALLTEDFAGSLERIKASLEEKIGEMKLSAEAYSAGELTLRSYIDAAKNMIGPVETAYAGVAEAALAALQLNYPNVESDSPERTQRHKKDGSHAAGLDYVPFDGYIAELHKGERILTAREAQQIESIQRVTLSPEFAAALSEYRLLSGRYSSVPSGAAEMRYNVTEVQSNVTEAQSFGDTGGISIVVSPTYNFSGTESSEQIEAVLARNNENLKELVQEALADIALDTRRREFR